MIKMTNKEAVKMILAFSEQVIASVFEKDLEKSSPLLVALQKSYVADIKRVKSYNTELLVAYDDIARIYSENNPIIKKAIHMNSMTDENTNSADCKDVAQAIRTVVGQLCDVEMQSVGILRVNIDDKKRAAVLRVLAMCDAVNDKMLDDYLVDDEVYADRSDFIEEMMNTFKTK